MDGQTGGMDELRDEQIDDGGSTLLNFFILIFNMSVRYLQSIKRIH